MRIKRSIILKQKLAHQYNSSSALQQSGLMSNKRNSVNRSANESVGDDDDQIRAGLENISIANPFLQKEKGSEIDQKRLSQLRAKQLQLSHAEREARNRQLA